MKNGGKEKAFWKVSKDSLKACFQREKLSEGKREKGKEKVCKNALSVPVCPGPLFLNTMLFLQLVMCWQVSTPAVEAGVKNGGKSLI